MGLEMGEGIFLRPFLSRQSLQELGQGSRQLVSTAGVSLSPQQQTEAKDIRDDSMFPGEICGGRQANGEVRGARAVLPLT